MIDQALRDHETFERTLNRFKPSNPRELATVGPHSIKRCTHGAARKPVVD
jgi:hypothetical protein